MPTWTSLQVFNWATRVGIAKEQATFFMDQQVDGDVLLDITKEDLVTMGFLIGPAIKILKALQPFRNTG